MKASTFARTIELAKLAAQVGLKELRSGDMKSRLEQATLIAKSLSNLKGAAMKAGQLLSLDLNHYFPPEAIEVLSQLQNAAVAQPFEQIEQTLRQELGNEKFESLKYISKTPIGVASIGQVHRAQYQNQEIVLKVQYSDVASSIESDLRILKTIAVSCCQLSGRRMDLDPLFQEFRGILEQEVDYRQEAQLQSQYQESVEGIRSAGNFSYRVPTIIDAISTGRIIAMSFEQGRSLRSWVTSKPNKVQKEHLAIAILDLYFHEFFEWGLVQTDPNWANFLIHEHISSSELVLLDFGATRKYSREFIQNYIQLLHFAASKNSKALRDHAIEFGLVDHRESTSAFLAFEEMLITAIRPFFSNAPSNSHFDFSDQSHSLNSQKAAKALAAELIYSPPPYGLVFLHRKLAGVYSILKSLEVKLDVSGYWQKMQELSAKKV
jgi:aarF domain-containing kinase